ncbi:uncharacterized protein FSUBG_5932 [Fusarium subglutinans]|uniref:Uncharacterized protein n=1 Tax=Gibberella subglutinans TaxID=42677 RepID=A0A8H5PZG8_GIBSU|nr:uncharacterized protein FSUBG_5932 [Fusarium subglutinans]KAF5606535.1 hypothetical protein FSUBG_5932 [Fusarium subglutinans]
MSSAPPRIEDTEHPSERPRVDEGVPPENKDAVRITILKDENKALTDEVGRLKQALEEAQNAASAANEAKDALKAENDELKKAQEQAREEARRDEKRREDLAREDQERQEMREEMESLRVAVAEATNDETRQKNALKLVQKHNYEIRIPATSHTQVMENFKPLVASGEEEHINNLLDFIFFGEPGTWYCFLEICEQGTKELTWLNSYDVQKECPTHGEKCKVMMCKSQATPPYQMIFQRFKPSVSSTR